MSDDLVKRAAALVEKQKAWDAWDDPFEPAPPAMVEGEVATLVSDVAEEITRLRAALATARRDGMEAAVSEAQARAEFWVSGNNEEAKIRYDEARKIAAAIRAAAKDDRERPLIHLDANDTRTFIINESGDLVGLRDKSEKGREP